MEENQTSFHTLLDKKSRSKFILHTRRKNGAFTICLTDAADVWTTDFTQDSLNQFRQRFSLKSTEDYILKLRSACSSGETSVVVHDSSVELQVGSSPGELSVTLSRLEALKASEELKELLFRMADSLSQPDGGSAPISPVKNQQRRPTEFEPPRRWRQNSAPSAAKKRALGGSLINPGKKKEVQATGVAFDEALDD